MQVQASGAISGTSRQQNVTRAIRRKTAEGKWAGSHLKHGYYKDAKSLTVQKQYSDARVADMKELVRAAKGDKMLVTFVIMQNLF